MKLIVRSLFGFVPGLAILIAAVTSDAQETKVEGFGGYRFGMTLEQALKVDPRRRAVDCDYPEVWKCIEYAQVFYGESAEVVVQFGSASKKVDQVVVQVQPDGRSTRGSL